MVKKTFLILIFALINACSIYVTEKNNENHFGGILTTNTVWDGNVVVEKDLLIPENITLSVMAGTKIFIEKSESSRTEPIFLLPETEIMVRGKMILKGEKGKTINLISAEKNPSQKDWGGIVVDGGYIDLNYSNIKNAYAAITVLDGTVNIKEAIFSENNMGLLMLEKGKGIVENIEIKNNKTGIIINNGNLKLNNILVENNEDGMIVKKISQETFNIKIRKNITGLIIDKNYIDFLLRANEVYENKDNVLFYTFNNILK